jgi:hypothetical protein
MYFVRQATKASSSERVCADVIEALLGLACERVDTFVLKVDESARIVSHE